MKIRRGREVVNAKAGTRVYKGDVVSTRVGQKATIATCSGSKVYVNQKSTVHETSRSEVRVQRGEVAEQVSKKSASVRTGEAVARANRTTLDVRTSRGQSAFIVASGSAEVSNRRGKVRVKQNQETRVSAGRAPARPVSVDAAKALNWASSLVGTWRILTPQGALQEPLRLAVDPKASVYVADLGTSSGQVVKLSASGQVQATWHLQGAGDPAAIALDAQQNLLVTDQTNASVQKLSTSGQVLAVYSLQGFNQGKSVSPAGIAVDRAGAMYVADEFGNRVLKLSPTGQLLTAFGSEGAGPGQFESPEGVAIDGAGNIYVADEFNDRVQKLSPAGQVLAIWSTGDNSSPTDLALDTKGNVYVAEANAGRIQEFSPTGAPVWAWQSDPLSDSTATGQFDRPYGVAVDRQNNVYVADRFNARIQVLAQP